MRERERRSAAQDRRENRDSARISAMLASRGFRGKTKNRQKQRQRRQRSWWLPSPAAHTRSTPDTRLLSSKRSFTNEWILGALLDDRPGVDVSHPNGWLFICWSKNLEPHKFAHHLVEGFSQGPKVRAVGWGGGRWGYGNAHMQTSKTSNYLFISIYRMFSSAANYNSCERSQGLTVWDMQLVAWNRKSLWRQFACTCTQNFLLRTKKLILIPHFDFTQHKHVTQFPCILALPLMHKVWNQCWVGTRLEPWCT